MIETKAAVLKLNPRDTVAVALRPITAGEIIEIDEIKLQNKTFLKATRSLYSQWKKIRMS
jgi:flagella basal body P-ring formation protein FlgA